MFNIFFKRGEIIKQKVVVSLLLLFIVMISAGTAFAASGDSTLDAVNDEFEDENSVIADNFDGKGNELNSPVTDELILENDDVLSAEDDLVETQLIAENVSYSLPEILEGRSGYIISLVSDGNPLEGKVITVNFAEEETNVTTIFDGVALYVIPDTYEAPGNYTMKIDFAGDDVYAASTLTTTLEFVEVETQIKALENASFPRVLVIDGPSYYHIELLELNALFNISVPVINKNISVRFNGGDSEEFTTNFLGEVDYVIPNETISGNYTIEVTYAGGEGYIGTTFSTNVEVYDLPAQIDALENVSYPRPLVLENLCYYPIALTTIVNITINGTEIPIYIPLVNRTVTVNCKGIEEDFPADEYGMINYTIPVEVNPGKGIITVTYAGEDGFMGAEFSTNITIYDIETHISVDNVFAYPRDDVNISISVIADDGVLVNCTVVVDLPDGDVKDIAIVNGTGNVTWTVPDGYEGDYLVNATFNGYDGYLPSNDTGVVTVEMVPTSIVVGNVSANPRDDVTIPITVVADDSIQMESALLGSAAAPKWSGEVTVVLPDGSTQTVEIVEGDGDAVWTVPDGYEGEYLIKASFDGDGRYLPSNGTGILTVEKILTYISIDNATARIGDNITLAVNVTADDDVPFFGNVTVALPDGSSQTVEIINGAGNVNWIISDGYEGENPINATFEGDGRYLASNGTATVTVERIPTAITVENITTRPENEIAVPINVETDDGVPFNGDVTVALPDGTNNTVEIVNGIGNTTWTVPADYVGDYNYSVVYVGNGTYLPSNNTAVITVIPKVPVEIIVGNVTAKPGDNVTIPVSAITEDGSAFNGNVTVTLPDGTKDIVEIINGTGNISWTVPENYNGTYPVIVTFAGNETYLAGNGTGIINVIPDAPVNPSNETVNPSSSEMIPIDEKATGNPIWALLIVLLNLVFVRRSRK